MTCEDIAPEDPGPRRSAVVVLAALALALVLILAALAHAHPGRLDREGCHEVHQRFVYQDGTVLEPGDRHCHRALGQLRLGEREILRDDEQERYGRPHPDEERREGM